MLKWLKRLFQKNKVTRITTKDSKEMKEMSEVKTKREITGTGAFKGLPEQAQANEHFLKMKDEELERITQIFSNFDQMVITALERRKKMFSVDLPMPGNPTEIIQAEAAGEKSFNKGNIGIKKERLERRQSMQIKTSSRKALVERHHSRARVCSFRESPISSSPSTESLNGGTVLSMLQAESKERRERKQMRLNVPPQLSAASTHSSAPSSPQNDSNLTQTQLNTSVSNTSLPEEQMVLTVADAEPNVDASPRVVAEAQVIYLPDAEQAPDADPVSADAQLPGMIARN